MSQLLALYMGSLILRSIGIALVAGISSWKIRNVAMRHAVWVAVLGSMLLMPVVDYLLPASWVPARVLRIAAEQPGTFRIVPARGAGAPQALAPSPAAMTSPARPSPVNWWNVAEALYAFVAFAMFIRLALGYRKIPKLRRNSSAIASPVWEEIAGSHQTRWRFPVLLESEAVQVPMTVGFLRPAVILPANWKTWDDWKMKAVLLHEIAHVRRCDWAIAAIAATSKCAYWLNPLSWFLERKLSQLAEQASDDASLCRTENATRYAEILLEFAATTQNGGRLMKGGVAMAQPNMKARIERMLGNPKTGTGIVKIAGWIFVMMAAVPVIYAAAALQVTSEPVKPTVATYAAEFGRNPLPQATATVSQASPSPSPTAAPQAQQSSSSPAGDLRDSFQRELEYSRTQYEELRRKLAEAQAIQASLGQAPDLQQTDRISGSVAFLQDELKKKDEQLTADALLDLPDNEDDLRAYLKQLARLRRNAPIRNSFSVSFAGIQGRTISMKVAEQSFTFGCESCSFLVGESFVSSAATAPPGPGMMIRLSPDGNDLTVTCRATLCNISFGGDNTAPLTMWQFVSGDSEKFAASKLRSVVISKD